MSKYKGTFSGTHRPARRDAMHKNLREARDEAYFNQAPAPGCALALIALTTGTAVLGVLGHAASTLA